MSEELDPIAKSPRKGFGQLGSKLVVAVMSLALGGWISSQLWPHWLQFRDPSTPRSDPAAPVSVPYAPPSAPDKAVSVQGTDASVSDTPLQLILVAASPAPNLADATASLGTDPRNPQTYVGGAVLSNGARIAEIHADRIVLAKGSKREVLALSGDSASRAAVGVALSAKPQGHVSPGDTPSFTVGNGGSLTSVGGAQRNKLDHEITSRIDLSDAIRTQPVFEDSVFRGLKVMPGTNASRLSVLGVEPGDVIRSVDGKLIQSASAWQQIDDALSAGESIVVGIEREGNLISVALDGSKLASDPSTT